MSNSTSKKLENRLTREDRIDALARYYAGAMVSGNNSEKLSVIDKEIPLPTAEVHKTLEGLAKGSFLRKGRPHTDDECESEIAAMVRPLLGMLDPQRLRALERKVWKDTIPVTQDQVSLAAEHAAEKAFRMGPKH